jgi:hypothetical protein
MKIVEGSFHSYRAPVDVGPSVIKGKIELRFAGKGRGSRGVELTASDARILAFALLAEAERADHPKSN